jgi:hypothetical protein
MHALLALCFLVPQDDLDARVTKLVQNLASDDLDARGAAEKELLKLGPPARAALARHRDHKDAEVRGRVQALLRHLAMLPVDDALRDPLRALESAEDLPALGKAAVELVKADRKKLREALDVAAKESGETLRFRANELANLLAADAVNGLRYGILFLGAETKAGAAVAAVPVWINDNEKAVSLWQSSGIATAFRMEKTEDGAELEGQIFVLEEPTEATFTVAGRSAASGAPVDVLSDGAKPGRYTAGATYTSDDQYVKEKPANFWKGRLTSPSVEITVR